MESKRRIFKKLLEETVIPEVMSYEEREPLFELRWSKISRHLLVFQNKALPLHQSRNSTPRDTAEWCRN